MTWKIKLISAVTMTGEPFTASYDASTKTLTIDGLGSSYDANTKTLTIDTELKRYFEKVLSLIPAGAYTPYGWKIRLIKGE